MKKVLFKSLLIISFLLITFFSIKIDSNAASFAYADFNWEEFLKQHKNYWVGGCEKDDEECVDRVLKTKEKFYKRLYSLLADYERKGYKIDDNIIIETVFFGLTPDSFADEGTHKNEYDSQLHEYGYEIDESEKKQKYIASDDNDKPGAKEYFEKETDSLKTLMNNMIGYTRECYGISNEVPQTVTYEDGSTTLKCSGDLIVKDGKCVAKVKTIKTNFFDSIGLGFLFSRKSEKECRELTTDYATYELGELVPKGVDEDIYWDFLIENTYFDNKFQLQSYFKRVLEATGHDSMDELSETEYEQHYDDIVEIRTRIVNHIKDILESYGEFAQTPDSYSGSSLSTKYWWPIGSTEITEVDGVKMASGDPASVNVSSNFGLRTHPVTGESDSMHYGIDITGTEGVVPVIAAANGVVVSGAQGGTGTCVNGDQECGGRFGNYVIIQHTDGNYTVYAHLHTNSVVVKEGDSVKQGQLIGYVGSTGRSTGGHLHFEVRVGGNDTNSADDPLNYISATDPRPTFAASEIMQFIGNMEGTGPTEGDYYIVYADSGGVLTVGHGITLKYNADQFRARGIDPSSLGKGSKVPKSIVDDIYQEDLAIRLDDIRKKVSSKGITLNDSQIAALASLQFNCGNINGFFENYQKYGSTQALCTNWWEQKALRDQNGTYLAGLKKRRVAECKLFVTGEYDMNIHD